MSLKYLLFFSIMLFFFTSCRETFVSSVENDDPIGFNLTSEIIANKTVSASLLRTLSFDQNNDDPVLSEAQMMFSGSNLDMGQISMKYQEESKKYIVDDPLVKIKEGNSYTISIESDDPSVDPVSATTYIPRAVKARSVSVRRVEESEVAGGKKYTIEVVVTLNEPLDLPAYYRVVPFRLISEVQYNSNGEPRYTDYNTRVELDIVDIVTNRGALSEFAHRDGIYADQSRLAEEEIHMVLETTEPLTSREIVRVLEFDIYTLSEELYRYNENIDLQINNAKSNYSSLTESYSNVNNGFGVFGGGSLTTLFINLN